jgi:predicted ATP-dependent endonuclease of OLD family
MRPYDDMFEALDDEPAFGVFKQKIIHHLMTKSGLIKKMSQKDEAEQSLTKLNDLLKEYANVKLEGTLDTDKKNAFNLTVQRLDNQETFLFDHLSSGQKEIIYTLYSIWEATRDHPSIVLIDEPELHLNAEWQVGFIATLKKLVPHNQYILATHSDFICQSIPDEHILELVD